MSKDARSGLSMPTSWKALACAVAALMAVGFTAVTSVSAQEASPVPAGDCVAPELPPGTATPMDASPVADEMAGMDMATPEAEEEATSPEAEDLGTPAEGEQADEILAAAWNLANCINSGDYEAAVALMTDYFLMEQFGITNPYDAIEILQGTAFASFEASNPTVYADGSVSADVQYQGSEYQLNGETWTLVQDGDYWKIDEFETFTPDYEGDSALVGINLLGPDDAGAYAIEPNAPSVVQTEVTIFHAVNAGTVDHELVVLRLPEGADPAGLLDGTISESDVEFIGQISVPVGGQGDMVLLGLEPGVYTLACFFPDDQGVPHAAKGMVAQFEVTAPA
jgi:hypothetical protein